MRHLFRSAPARLAAVGFTVFFGVSLVSRLLLLVMARHEVTWGLPLAGALATGFWYDAAAAVFAALPWLLLGAVMPVRWLKSLAGTWLVACLMTVFIAILIFITTAEWIFWDEFGARFNFIAVDYLTWTQEVWGNIRESYPIFWILAGIAAVAAILV